MDCVLVVKTDAMLVLKEWVWFGWSNSPGITKKN